MHIFVQILLSLSYIHRNNIDHRDLKPLNILLFLNGLIAKLADFGLAKYIKSEQSHITSGVGTQNYIAPEALDGKHAHFKSDIFSLGIILYQMLTFNIIEDITSIDEEIEKIPS